jgi:hypothetical protein
MSAEKRPAADSFGSSQLVKRQKSDANLGNSSSVAVVNGAAQHGALIQAVCNVLLISRIPQAELNYGEKETWADVEIGLLGTAHKRASSAYNGIDWYAILF